MSTTVTDILRPASAEAATWPGFDVALIADAVVEPDAGDSMVAAADTSEQVVLMGPPSADGYSAVTRLELKLLGGGLAGTADLSVRLRLEGVWLASVPAVFDEQLRWHTVGFDVATSRSALSGLAVGMAKDGGALAVVDALYVKALGPAQLVEPGDDVAVFDGAEAVRLVRLSGGEVLIAHALRSRASVEEADTSGGAYLRHDLVWHVPAGEVEAPPQVAEHIADDAGDRWTILAVDRATLGTRYRCRARKLSITNDVAHLADVERAVWTKDADGAEVAHWIAWRRNVPARVQPIAAVVGYRRDQQTTDVTHRVTFAVPMALDHNTRIVHQGKVYRVVAVDEENRIDRLPSAEVVETS